VNTLPQRVKSDKDCIEVESVRRGVSIAICSISAIF